MKKACKACETVFLTFDSRRKFCSKECGYLGRGKSASPGDLQGSSVAKLSLPPPEELPAPYAKRVHDMWATLVGNSDSATRIA
ncbi:MAG: hypothetical protein EBS53_00280 [Bacteroidetes bacterium]|nr:hypothetical protein [Bacteroidota bacterium]